MKGEEVMLSMRRNMRLGTLVGLVGLLIGGLCLVGQRRALADAPATQPAAGLDDDYVMTKSRMQSMPAVNVLILSDQTTMTQIGDTVRALMAKFGDAEKAGKFRPRAAPIFIMHGMTPDPSKAFTLDVAFPVADDTKAFDDFQVKKLDTFKCAVVIYSGPTKTLGQAFAAIYEDVMTAGLQPTGELREEQLKWEDGTSPNNVTMIELGVQ
jgi:effector-binding domain-containing protein